MKRSLFIAFCSILPLIARAEPDAETVKIAEEMAITIGLEKQMANGFSAMIPAIEQISKRLNLGPAESDELKGIYRSWFLEDIDQVDLKKKIVQIYAQSYTKEELIELNKFYKSPLGQKTLQTMPEVMKQSSMAGMQAAQAKQQALQDRLKPFMEKHAPQAPQAPQQPGTAPAPEAPKQ
jgi:uncharacterized protein